MSLSLFDLSDYSGNRRSYWKGIKKAQQEKNNPITILDLSLLGVGALILGGEQFCFGVFKLLPPHTRSAFTTDGLPRGAAAFFQAPGGEQTLGYPMQMSTRSECKALMKMVFLSVYLSLCLQGAILLR